LDGNYISAEKNGTTSGHRTNLDSRVKWTIISAHPHLLKDQQNISARGVVKIFDTIALRCCFTTYLTFENDGTINTLQKNVQKEQTLKIARANLPFIPEWVRKRSTTISNSTTINSSESLIKDQSTVMVLNTLPVDVQEQLLVEDLLFTLMGIEGKYIRFVIQEDGSTKFLPSPVIKDKSLVQVLTRILPGCEYYYYVQTFVSVHSRFEYGLIHHAFTCTIRTMLKEYLILIAQLEHQFLTQQLTLLRIWFYLQPSLLTMERLYKICSKVSHVTGGTLLNVLQKTINNEG
jgi:gamma-tubulin complex component 2